MDDWRRTLSEALGGHAADVRPDEPLAGHTTFRIGGPADAWVEVRDRAALSAVLEFCRSNGIESWLLGRGSNVLVSDQGLRGVVVTMSGSFSEVAPFTAGGVRAGAAATLDQVADAAEKAGLVGAGFLAGIPGTIGGGLRSNSGAFGRSLADITTGISVLDREGKGRMLHRGDLHVGYREPLIDDGLVALEVELELAPGIPEPAARTREQRWAKHPKEPSAGSFFKNPVVSDESRAGATAGNSQPPIGNQRVPAGRLIDQCGLKGRSVGGAKVSETHANFIVNTGRARFADVYELAQIVKATVEQETGFLLEEEVQILPGMRR